MDVLRVEMLRNPHQDFILSFFTFFPLSRGIIRNNSMWDHFVLKKIRYAFGGKIRLLVAGGAPIRTEVLSFFKCSVGCPVSYSDYLFICIYVYQNIVSFVKRGVLNILHRLPKRKVKHTFFDASHRKNNNR